MLLRLGRLALFLGTRPAKGSDAFKARILEAMKLYGVSYGRHGLFYIHYKWTLEGHKYDG